MWAGAGVGACHAVRTRWCWQKSVRAGAGVLRPLPSASEGHSDRNGGSEGCSDSGGHSVRANPPPPVQSQTASCCGGLGMDMARGLSFL